MERQQSSMSRDAIARLVPALLKKKRRRALYPTIVLVLMGIGIVAVGFNDPNRQHIITNGPEDVYLSALVGALGWAVLVMVAYMFTVKDVNRVPWIVEHGRLCAGRITSDRIGARVSVIWEDRGELASATVDVRNVAGARNLPKEVTVVSAPGRLVAIAAGDQLFLATRKGKPVQNPVWKTGASFK
jgi:hypothetical protein